MLSVAPFPRRVSVELTNHCNQRCPLCPRQELTRPLGFMSPALFERIASECGGQQTRLWLHFLGEPLLHRHALAMVAAAKAAGVLQVGLSTNAVALGTYADAILASGLDRLECSVDATNPTDYAAARGRDHFARVVANIREFLERKRRAGNRPATSIQFMRTPKVDASIEDIVDQWQPFLGADDFVMTIEPATFRGRIRVPWRQDSPTRQRGPCRWLFESLMILQDGTVTMCGADWDASAPLGNVNDESIAAIWGGARMARYRDAHLRADFGAVGPCGTCEDWRLADGSGYVNASAAVAARRASIPPSRTPVR